MQDEVDNSLVISPISSCDCKPAVSPRITLQERILSLLRQQPCTAHHAANALTACLYSVWRALKDMEAQGSVYHRSYPVRWPSGAEHIVRVYFPAGLADGMTSFLTEHRPMGRCSPAGLADGMTSPQDPGAPDLIDRLAARTIEQGKFVQKRNLALLKELGRSLRV